MSLRERFNKYVTKMKWWSSEDEVLVAVSAGVDSIVLLHLLCMLPKEIKPKLRVVHVNHQLREVSKQESEFVEAVCASLDISFYQSVWEEGPQIKNNIELAAREHRYSFFSKVMIEENIPTLLTAHHQDDQVETFLMRLTTGGRLSSLVGIEEKREFANGQLIRPLLIFKKEELYQFANDHSISFYE
ncbi:tRNA lysidine(34) synthetase TilS, partial [Acinetobacter baumannii]|uniref:tRNA lysidine(34) synthetase TilS n=1 Tax=Acinetobacter baumannii TaxID=470 RepID=UPI001AED11AD